MARFKVEFTDWQWNKIIQLLCYAIRYAINYIESNIATIKKLKLEGEYIRLIEKLVKSVSETIAEEAIKYAKNIIRQLREQSMDINELENKFEKCESEFNKTIEEFNEIIRGKRHLI